MNTIIQLQDPARSFGSTSAINGISFNVEKREVFGLLGPNGSGKTTLVMLLNGGACADIGKGNPFWQRCDD